MQLYRLRFVLHQPNEDPEGKYRAEIPDLPGCRAWGDTAAEVLENLQGVATAFIESYKSRGDPLPAKIAQTAVDAGTKAHGEVLVAA